MVHRAQEGLAVVDVPGPERHGVVMHVRLPGRRTIVAHAFPSTDPQFAQVVSSVMEGARQATTDADELREAVTRALRRAYPDAELVVGGDLAQIVDREQTWYVFRDGRAIPPRDPPERP
jgi:hypothetical protein